MNTSANGHILPTRPRQTARWLLTMTPPAMPLPLLPEQKKPAITNWREFTCTCDDIDRWFSDDGNVGALLGEKSYGLVDVDLDAQEAMRVARFYLPQTSVMFGRESKRRSHYLFRLTSLDGAREIKYPDPSMTPERRARGQQAMLLELRFSGQTVMPGSINVASGQPELVDYEPDSARTVIDIMFAELKMALDHIAAGSMMARLWIEGGRHALSLPLAGFLFHGGMALDKAEVFLRAICAGANETETETDDRLHALRDSYRKGLAGLPITGGPTLEDIVGASVVNKLRVWLDLKKQTTDARIYGSDGLPLAHDGDAARFQLKYGEQVIYCAVEKRWYLWNGHYWQHDRTFQVREYAKVVAKAFRATVAEALKTNPAVFGVNGVGTLKECSDWAKSMGNDQHITAMLNSVMSLPQIAVEPEQLNANCTLLNFANVTLSLDVKTGRITERAQNPDDYITMSTHVTYDPTARQHDLIDEYHQRFFPEDARWAFLWEMAAEAATGLPKRHSLNLIGVTNAGKSMTLSLVGGAFGDYAATLEYTSLVRNSRKGGDTPRADLWRVRHKRLVTISEVPPDATLDVALYKTIEGGGDKMAIRTLYDAHGGTDVQWGVSIWMSGNQPYGPPANEEAAYERLLPLLCEHQVPADERNQQKQQETLDPSVTGAVVWNLILDAFQRLYGKQGGNIHAPDVVLKYRDELQDTLDAWTAPIEALFEFTKHPNDGVLKEEAWNWARELRLQEEGGSRLAYPRREQGKFEVSMQRRGAKANRRSDYFKNRHYWEGVRWLPDVLAQHRVKLPDEE